MCITARRCTEHGGGVTVLMRQRPRVGIHHRGTCYTSRRHGNGYQSGLRAAGEVGGGERVLAAMVDVHGGITRSYMMAVVAVKLAAVLATSPNSDDQMREREVGGGWVVVGHGRA